MDKWEFLEIMGPGRYSDVPISARVTSKVISTSQVLKTERHKYITRTQN